MTLIFLPLTVPPGPQLQYTNVIYMFSFALNTSKYNLHWIMKLIPLLDCIPSVIQYCAMASHNRNVKTNAGQSIHSGLKCNYMNKNCFVTTRTSVLMIFFSSPEPRCDCPPPPPPPTPFVSFSNRRINPWIALVLKNLIDTDWEQFINRSNEANKFDRALHDSTISQAEAGVYLHICPQRGGVHVSASAFEWRGLQSQ